MPTPPLLPPLVDAATLAARLHDPAVRVFDATVALRFTDDGATLEPQRDAYRRGHVPGAAFADLPGALSDPDARFPVTAPSAERFAAEAGALGIGKGVHAVVYAQESPMWATRLWWLLRYFGFDAVSVLDGGLPAWRAAGLDLATGEETYPAAELVARPRPELLASQDDVAAIVAGEAPACLVNALAPELFRGEAAGGAPRPGRIPGSENVPAGGLLDPATNRLRPLPELRARLEAAAPVDGPPVVAYCGGEIAATLDLFALHLTGREGRLYDGSMVDWSSNPERPLEVG
ncbi:sulfurtransferase [Patulibacter sp. S7RM1-6]